VSDPTVELRAIEERYHRRRHPANVGLYHPLDAYVVATRQERERGLVRWARRNRLRPVGDRRVLEVGCGSGINLLELIRLGFNPRHLVGIDLLPDRAELAKRQLPADVTILTGDAAALDFGSEPFHAVLAFTVFSSILDDDFQRRIAARMWELVEKGGGVLLYDFVLNNPKNRDVRAVPLRRMHQLFPEGAMSWRRLTLAPPIGRRLCAILPGLYPIANVPLLRSHVMCWIEKPR
jgi:SAM-dependent methyltransferase